MDEWLKKMWYEHTVEYYSLFRRKEILSYETTKMNLEDFTVNKIGQSQNDKYCIIPLIWGI